MSELGALLEREMEALRAPEYPIADVARRRDRRRRNRRLGSAALALIVAGLALVALTKAFSHVDRRVPTSPPPTSTIVFSRQVAGSDYDYVFTTTPDGSHPARLLRKPSDTFRISPDGARVLFADVYPERSRWVDPGIVNLDGTERIAVPIRDATLTGLWPDAWSPDGGRFAAQGLGGSSSSSSRGIYTARTSDGGDLVRVTISPDGHHDYAIGYSEDGSRILFLRRSENVVSGGDHDLFVVNVDGTRLTQLNPPGTRILTSHPNDALSSPGAAGDSASWSPDAGRVTFVASRGDPDRRAIFVVDVGGREPRRITAWGTIQSARWSPDGAWIAYSELRDGVYDLFVTRPDGSETRQVTSHSDGLMSVGGVWSPDGSRLLFVRNPDGSQFNSNLWIVNVDGTDLVQVTDRPAEYWSYEWSPVEIES